MNSCPIGIFDSGVGGLSVFAELINLLPNENYLYFGDTKNLPYGNKSKEELVKLCTKIFDFFKERNVKAVVMACNTTSAIVYDTLKDNYNFKIYPVVQTISKQITSNNIKNIGVFATNATINSHAYKTNLKKYKPELEVYEIACPKWVDIVENEKFEEKESLDDIKKHLEEMKKNDVEKIILGCTHYPYLLDTLSKFESKNLFINPAKYFSQYIKNDLENLNLLNNKKDYEPQFFVSANPQQFIKASKLFFNVEKAQEINLN